MIERPRTWNEIDWQVQGCGECPNRAELLYDEEPLCVECADLLLERQVAAAMLVDADARRSFLASLPAIGDR